MNPNSTRRIPLEGCLNFRDLGGYPTQDGRTLRWGLIFRSDSLHELTPSDLHILRDEIGIRDAIDLRSSLENQIEHLDALRDEPVQIHHHPLFDGDSADHGGRLRELPLDETYLTILETAQNPIRQILTTIANTTEPLVYFCAAGKDRTGVISALLQGLLGVTEDAIIADYALSQERMEAIIKRLKAMGGYESIFDVLPEHTLHAREETMHSFLAQAKKRYGSISTYLLETGLASTTLTQIRERLLEET